MSEAVSFEWILDLDARFGPFLEAIVNGRYFLVPFYRIRSMSMERPGSLTDLAYQPVRFTWSNGGEVVGYVPMRYPDSEKSEEHELALARRTVWSEPKERLYLGLGQRSFITSKGDEFDALDVRQVDLDTKTDSQES